MLFPQMIRCVSSLKDMWSLLIMMSDGVISFAEPPSWIFYYVFLMFNGTWRVNKMSALTIQCTLYRKIVVTFIGWTFVFLVHHSRNVQAQRSLRRPVRPAEGWKQVLRRQKESELQWYETPRQERSLGKNLPKSHHEKKRMRRFGKITS